MVIKFNWYQALKINAQKTLAQYKTVNSVTLTTKYVINVQIKHLNTILHLINVN